MIERGVETRAKFILTLIHTPKLAVFCRKLGKVARCDIPLFKLVRPINLCNWK